MLMCEMPKNGAMAKKKTNRKPPRKPPVRQGVPVTVWLNDQLMAMLERHRQHTRRTRTAEIEIALEEMLKTEGLWPPVHQQPPEKK